jgi:DMSO/TMAO reductase YedYZ molybdopterin-dependent catalytic subunit
MKHNTIAARSGPLTRRAFLKHSALAGAAGALGLAASNGAQETAKLPFENGVRELVRYPQKRPLLRLTTRPPQLETPFSAFNEGVITPNDAFFVRYHLTHSPPGEELLAPEKFRLRVVGSVKTPLSLSMPELKAGFEPVEMVAVNQCSGNSRGLFEPRIPGGQSGNGMMGNARWRGVRLKDVLAKAGLESGSRQVTFNGLDAPVLPQTPDFIKALDLEHGLDGEVMLAYEMNGEDLPWLNGYPLRLVVPGYFGTYWIKHLHEISVLKEVYDGYWMSTAYRIPDNECGCVPPGTKPSRTVPIERFNVRSFITSLAEGATVKAGQTVTVRGFAFDGGYGIQQVLFSEDDGRSWREGSLKPDLGKYSFREFTVPFTPRQPGKFALKVKATNRIGQSQPMEPLWNPAGYMRNVVETVNISAV